MPESKRRQQIVGWGPVRLPREAGRLERASRASWLASVPTYNDETGSFSDRESPPLDNPVQAPFRSSKLVTRSMPAAVAFAGTLASVSVMLGVTTQPTVWSWPSIGAGMYLATAILGGLCYVLSWHLWRTRTTQLGEIRRSAFDLSEKLAAGTQLSRASRESIALQQAELLAAGEAHDAERLQGLLSRDTAARRHPE